MIPREIHYIWFGGKRMPPSVEKTIASWKSVLPGYRITCWNEDNFDVRQHPWMESMYREGKFAFASDWARLFILQQNGGIYLDTDVEIRKSFDPFLAHETFWGFEYDCYLATCMIGSVPGHPLLGNILAAYDSMTNAVVNNTVVTRYFLEKVEGFRLDNTQQSFAEGVEVYPKEYFSVPSFNSSAGYCRHHGSNLWKGGKNSSFPKRCLRRMIGEALYFKLVAHKVCKTNEFYPIYRSHKGKHEIPRF